MDREDVVLFISRLDVEKTTKLSLSNKDLDEIPAEIGRLSYLKHLDLSYNNIRELPTELFKLHNLETLLLFRNSIEVLPQQIGNLNNLTLLDISYNNIREIPASISSLANLKTFDAGHCQIVKLPYDFIKLLSLKDLYIENNPIEFPPHSVIKRGLYATMYYLAQEKKKIETTKVILQVYNMPEEIQSAFKQYINCFNDVISALNERELKFETKFINPLTKSDTEFDGEVEQYLYSFLQFIRENLSVFKDSNFDKHKLNVADLQLIELRSEITRLSESLREEIEETRTVYEKLNKFALSLNPKP